MKIAVCSDEPYAVHQTIAVELKHRGHEVHSFGAFAQGQAKPWALVAERAATAVARGDCDQGIFLCWSGTGIAMAANKVPGIRAALCQEAGGARAARIWNHANVLCLSNRLLSDDVAKEIMAAWFETRLTEEGARGVELLTEVEARCREPKAI